MSTPRAEPSRIADRRVEVETPELVGVSYTLADLGSRFSALMLDGLILFAVLLAIMIAGGIALASISDGLGRYGDWVVASGLAILLIAQFLVVWGYFIYFEAFRDGQTPGKRKLGLRVVQDGGYPLDLRGAAVRNLLRLVDSFPPPTWLLGGTVMMLHPKTKRVGDLVAGTMVVRERGEPSLPEAQAAAGAAGPPQLREEEYEMVARYVRRRDELPLSARSRIAGQLLERVVGSLSEDPRGATYSADGLLLQIYADETRRRSDGTRARGSYQAAALVRRQAGRWARFTSALDQARDRGLSRLPEEEVSRFAAMYRETAADLARARAYGASPELVYSLERWVGAGHNLLYRPVSRTWAGFRSWLTAGFPALFRSRWQPIALAALMLFGPMAATGGSIYVQPERARTILSAEMLARAENGAERRAAGQGYVDMPPMGMPLMASGIIANNVQVTFVAFAGGILAGLGTVAILVFNGVFLGASFGIFAAYGLGGHLLAFVLPHGVIELTAICIAGGAGLWYGSALFLPGRLTRREALVTRGGEAVSLVGGAAVLLVVAGLVEGFVSPAPFPIAVKAGVSALSAVVLAGYLGVAGKNPSR
jgi:uncharacterized membrane protein SpoIIM required for sporulation/uncharacterized RDD family membrane protein YckC